MKCKILFVAICSNGKISGGRAEYNFKNSVVNFLSAEAKDALMETREFNFQHIKEGGYTRGGKLLRDFPYNKNLKKSFDFGGRETAEFLPAYKRYRGRFYREIRNETWENRKHNVIIFSGLYGWVLPEEDIQLYSLDLRDSQIITDAWNDIATLILEDFIENLGVEIIFDCTGVKIYRDVIDWQYLKEKGYKVFHIYGEQNPTDAVLPSIGYFLEHKGLTAECDELMELINRDLPERFYPSPLEKIYFIKDAGEIKELNLPQEEKPELQKKDKLVSEERKPVDIREFEKIAKVKIEFTERVLSSICELPKEIASKFLEKLKLFVKNPSYPSLHTRKIEKDGKIFWRFRITRFYRAHVEWVDKKILRIRAIGPRNKLEGIG